MGQAAHAQSSQEHGGGHGGDHHGSHHAPIYYVKIWGLLLVLLAISIAGPMLGHKILTLITAFGIAIVKALIVAAFFMHLNIEKKYVWYILFGMLAMVGMFFFGTAADIMKPTGSNWEKISALQLIEEHKNMPHDGEHGSEHGGSEHGGEGEHK
jgi:caa(3)-type oxidase subunit IV